jgi:N-carbamoylputrescine amidase
VNRVGAWRGQIRSTATFPEIALPARASSSGAAAFLADPFGRVIAKASHDAEEILLGEIDLG